MSPSTLYIEAGSILRPFILSSLLTHLILNGLFLWQVLEAEMPGGGLAVEVRNRVGEGQLNEGCGAEWAQKVRGGRTSMFELCKFERDGSGMKWFSHGYSFRSRD